MNENKAIERVKKLVKIYEGIEQTLKIDFPNDERMAAIAAHGTFTAKEILKDLLYQEENEWFA